MRWSGPHRLTLPLTTRHRNVIGSQPSRSIVAMASRRIAVLTFGVPFLRPPRCSPGLLPDGTRVCLFLLLAAPQRKQPLCSAKLASYRQPRDGFFRRDVPMHERVAVQHVECAFGLLCLRA